MHRDVLVKYDLQHDSCKSSQNPSAYEFCTFDHPYDCVESKQTNTREIVDIPLNEIEHINNENDDQQENMQNVSNVNENNNLDMSDDSNVV